MVVKCGVDLAATLLTASPGNFLCVNDGVNIVTFRVRDRQGNEAANATVANVTVEDNLNPTAIALTNLITVNLSSPILSGLSLDGGSTDNCSIDAYQIDGNPHAPSIARRWARRLASPSP
ncbi:MAG: hypothetical protein HC888_09695 [Candidatus Competibacteraceae bacterium]|nr:hypothetical protein [Candidatus Competibacteraceae bacterium]